MLHIRPESFPVSYDLNHLALIFTNNTSHWTEYISLSNIRQVQRDAANAWLRTCLRYSVADKSSIMTGKTLKGCDPEGIYHYLKFLSDFLLKSLDFFRKYTSTTEYI